MVGKEIPKFIIESNFSILGNFNYSLSITFPYILLDIVFSLNMHVSISYKEISMLPIVKYEFFKNLYHSYEFEIISHLYMTEKIVKKLYIFNQKQ